MSSALPMVAVILVNWNGWKDTIECLESVLRLRYPNYRVIVCDNASGDSSLDHVVAWANGGITAQCSSPRMLHLTAPPTAKPVAYIRLGPGEFADLSQRSEKLILVQTGANLGYAGGNNAGLRLALAAGDTQFVWVLNNDTVVDPDAMMHLVRRMTDNPTAGICGSTLLYYDFPDRVQTLGGAMYRRWVARIRQIGTGISLNDLPGTECVESAMDYVAGASMLLRRELLETVGLLDDRYFLYFEEIDLATRAKGKYTLAYARESRVYHKEGASTGTARLGTKRSSISEFYSTRSRVLFTRRYTLNALPTVVLAIIASGLERAVTGKWHNLRALLQGCISGLLADLDLPGAKLVSAP